MKGMGGGGYASAYDRLFFEDRKAFQACEMCSKIERWAEYICTSAKSEIGSLRADYEEVAGQMKRLAKCMEKAGLA